MATSESHVGSNRKSASAGRLALSATGGFIVGIAAYYLISAVATAPLTGWSTVHPLILLMIGLLSAASVVTCWRWPVIGVIAGAVVVALVVFVVAQRISWTSNDIGALRPKEILGFGAASGYPTMIGAVMVSASALRLVSQRAR